MFASFSLSELEFAILNFASESNSVIKGLIEFGRPKSINLQHNFNVRDDILKFISENGSNVQNINVIPLLWQYY